MREIKFRAWMENKMLSHEDLVDMDQEFYAMYTILTEPQEDITFMQYTGLKDKNGKEIYEGDIIYWEINNGVGIESYTAIVKWSENLVEEGWSQTFKWLVGYTGNYYRGSYDELSTPAAYNDELQVIGNIYENPEVLEESQNGTK